MFNGRFVKRSWGWYWTILDRKYFKVKLLRFKRGAQMSNQYHLLRNELWLFLRDGIWQSIPKEHVHTFKANKTCYVIEVQYGDKCVEEDIVRV